MGRRGQRGEEPRKREELLGHQVPRERERDEDGKRGEMSPSPDPPSRRTRAMRAKQSCEAWGGGHCCKRGLFSLFDYLSTKHTLEINSVEIFHN